MAPPHPSPIETPRSPAIQPFLLAGWIFAACFIGIASRPLGFAAIIWPANALFLGLLARRPDLAQRPLTWLLAFAAYILADLIIDSTIIITLGMNVANIIGVAAGWLYLKHYHSKIEGLRHPQAVLHIAVASLLSACASAVVGAPAVHLLFDTSLWHATVRWVAGELFNLLLIVPLVIAAPRGWVGRWQLSEIFPPATRQLLPVFVLILSEAISYFFTGAGTLGFSIPALIWCAMIYGVFPITLLSLIISLAKFIFITNVPFTQDQWLEASSFFIGVALISLAPLAVAVAYRLSSYTLQKLQFAANHDFLTNTLSRRALMEMGTRQLQRLRQAGESAVILLIDLDHFKSINDRYGHAQGDAVLQQFSALVQKNLRPDDLFGRIGGEEFVLLLPRISAEQATQIAERLRTQFVQHSFTLAPW